MTRHALRALVFGLLLAACGGGGNGGDDHQTPPMDAPTTHSVCGDGIVDVATETCDDGNTTSGDGCSSTCHTETVNTCGNGHLDGTETCDDGNAAGSDGCSAQCTVEMGYTCTGSPSVCTQMSAAAGTCAMPFPMTLALANGVYTASGAGDSSTSTNQVDGAPCDQYSLSGRAGDHIWSFTNPVAQSVVIKIDGTQTAFDAVLRLTSTACDLTTEVPDTIYPDDADGMADGCSDEGGTDDGERLIYSMLPAGTYYILIDGYYDDSSGPYAFTVTAGTTTCGDGTAAIAEECDDHNTNDHDGCSAGCTIEPGFGCTGTSPSVCTALCGNGMLDDGEDCDDGNTHDHDGCSAACAVEPGYTCSFDEPSVCTLSCGNGDLDDGEECDSSGVANARCTADCHLVFDTAEVENNNDAAHAQVITPVHHIISGSLPVGDLDVYTFTLTGPATVEIETYTNFSTNNPGSSVSALGVECHSADTQVRIYASTANPADDTAYLFYDDDDGDGLCSYVGPLDAAANTAEGVLAAGTYYFAVHEYHSDDAIDRYLLDFKVTPH